MQFVVNIDVEDIERAISFYERGLGLALRGRLFGGTVAEMAGGPSPVYLIEKPARGVAVPGTAIRRDYRRHWTPVHLDFVVEDLDAALGRALAAGAMQEGAVRDFAWGRLASLSDPFGNGLCLLAFAEGGYDQAA